MELVVKFCADQTIRIGVRFIYEYLAVKPYETIVSRHGTENFSIRMELERGTIKLVLRSDNDGGKFEYKELTFRVDQVKRLKDMLSHEDLPVKFVHVYPKENRLYIAKPFRMEKLIQVSRVEFVGME